jgi:hypothetical protein
LSWERRGGEKRSTKHVAIFHLSGVRAGGELGAQ